MKNKNIIIEFSPKTVLWVIATVAALWLVITIKEVLVILFLSYIFAAAINPFVDRLEKKKVPRVAAIFVVYIIIIAIVALFIEIVVPPLVNQASQLVHNSGKYIERINSFASSLNPELRGKFVDIVGGVGNSISSINTGEVVIQAFGVFSGAVGLIAVLVISFYLLIQKNGVEKALAFLLPRKYHQKSFAISRKIEIKMSSWVRGQLFLAFLIFVINYIALSILKVDMALTLALLSGLLEMLPIIGPIVAGAAATLVALTISPLLALIVAAWYILVQQLENHILVPQVMKKSVGLNPILVIVAILVGGKVMGFWGILIAVPIFACLAVIFDELWKKNKEE